MTATQVTDPVAHHGEGPVWWPDGHLRLVDMLAGDVLDLHDGEVSRRHVGEVAAVVRPRRSGGAVVATARGLTLFDDAWHAEGTVGPLWDDVEIRLNEGGCDPAGRLYVGSMATDASPGRGDLLRFDDPDTFEVVVGGVTISNGLEFTRDGTVAYYTDTPTGRVDVVTVDEHGRFHDRRPWIDVPAAAGRPDGIALDAAGGIWVACWGGGQVRHHDADGVLDEVVDVPTPHVTACALGGPHLDTLFVTTSQLDLAPGRSGPAGAVFCVNDVAPGNPVLTCRF